MQKDTEGNGFSQVDDVEGDALCVQYDDEEDIEVYSMDWSAEDAGFEDDEWEEFKANAGKCVIIFPYN
jgi:hypothetical protein